MWVTSFDFLFFYSFFRSWSFFKERFPAFYLIFFFLDLASRCWGVSWSPLLLFPSFFLFWTCPILYKGEILAGVATLVSRVFSEIGSLAAMPFFLLFSSSPFNVTDSITSSCYLPSFSLAKVVFPILRVASDSCCATFLLETQLFFIISLSWRFSSSFISSLLLPFLHFSSFLSCPLSAQWLPFQL